MDSEDCNTGFHGDYGWMGFTLACLDGGCAKPLDENAPCTSVSFQNSGCDIQKKLRCNASTCTKWTFAKLDEACTTSAQTPSGSCSGDLRCIPDVDGAASGSPGTCKAKAIAGASCVKDYDCRFGLTCETGTCAVAPADRCK
jgi:hypothetical protein